jgi:hypothetical protein
MRRTHLRGSIAQIEEPGRTGRTLRVPDWLKGSCSGERRIMAQQVVMDVTGDTRDEFDPADAAAVAEALARFNQLIDAGFTAAVRRGPGSSELVRHLIPLPRRPSSSPG